MEELSSPAEHLARACQPPASGAPMGPGPQVGLAPGHGPARTLKTDLATTGALLAFVLFGGAAFIYLGVYDVAATTKHWSIATWMMETARVHSIKAHAAGIVPPGDLAAKRGSSRAHRTSPSIAQCVTRLLASKRRIWRRACTRSRPR